MACTNTWQGYYNLSRDFQQVWLGSPATQQQVHNRTPAGFSNTILVSQPHNSKFTKNSCRIYNNIVKTCGRVENDEAKSGNEEAKGVPGRRGVTEGDGTMWRRFDEEEKCWRVWGRRKMGDIRWWRTWPQLMCCALACGTRCPLISGARKTVRMTKNKARMYRF